jgi:uncharacterized protein (DUF362 family)
VHFNDIQAGVDSRCSCWLIGLIIDSFISNIILDLIGGINNFVKPESSVLLKPNLLMAVGPDSAVVTNPEVVRAVVKILKEINCRIYLGDGPSVWGKESENIIEVYEKTGIMSLAKGRKN